MAMKLLDCLLFPFEFDRNSLINEEEGDDFL